jgi:hypothetical protein
VRTAGDPSSAASTTLPFRDHTRQREYAVRQQLKLVNEGPGVPEKQNIWVALIRDFPPYQEVRSMQVSPRDYQRVSDEYGNQYAEFDFSDHAVGTDKIIQIEYRQSFTTGLDLSNCEGIYLMKPPRPELHIERPIPKS